MMVITQKAVRDHLSYAKASELIANGLDRLANGSIESPTRHVFRSVAPGPVLGFMPAVDEEYMSAKVAAVSYANVDQGLDSHQGAVLLFARSTGELKATIDATELTAIRTTAVSHLVLSQLIRRKHGAREIRKIAIIGSGVQAFHHIRMLLESFGTTHLVVVSRSPQRVRELQLAIKNNNVSLEHRLYGAGLQDCDIIITATHGTEIVLNRGQVSANCLIIAMGACQPKAQEIDGDILSECLFIVDSKDATLLGSGEGLARAAVSVENEETVYDLHDLLGSRILGLDKMTRPILFKSVGLGFEDLVCSAYLYERLKTMEGSLAISISDFGGRRAY
jgi:ornithine cyclodeaminase/alanine dehydrogenase-like protein (mu-crystallin family)